MNKLLEPCNDRVVVKPIDEGEQMYGSIVVPDMGKERPEMGQVIAVGPGRLSEFGKMVPVRSCAVGDTVLIPKMLILNNINSFSFCKFYFTSF